jgi:MFS family permease
VNEASASPGRPDPDPIDGEAEKASHYAWNLRVNVVVELFWGFALSLVSTYTMLPVFLAGLGASNRLIAAVPGVSLAGYALLQLPSAYFTTRLRHKTSPMIWIHLPIAAAWVAAALVARNVAPHRPGTAQALFLGCVAVANLIGGIGIPMWADYLNRQTPARTRGRFFGGAFAAGSVAALGGGVFAHRVLDRLSFPGNFGICFFIAGSAMFVGVLPYMLVREAPVEPTRFAALGDFLRHVRRAVGRGSALRRLVAARWVMEAGVMAAAFYAVRALNVSGLPNSAAGTFTIVATMAQVPAMLIVGRVGDRSGFRLVMAAGGLLAALATGTALLGRCPTHFYLVFAFSGLVMACDLVSSLNLVMELSPDRDKTIYQAIYNTLLVPPRVAYPVLAGWVAESFGMQALFAIALLMQLMGAMMVLLLVREPKGALPPRVEEVYG